MRFIPMKEDSPLVKAIVLLWAFCCIVILVICAFFSLSVLWGIPGFAGIVLLGAFIQRFLKRQNLSTFILIFGILFLLVQIVLVYAYYFETGWDVQGIVAAAEQFANREKVTAYPFSRFPNNLLMTILYSRVFRLATRFGLSRDCGYQMILLIQCVLSFVTGQLTFYNARSIIGNDSFAAMAFFLYCLLIGLSPWVSILYSESLALVFPTTVLWMYLLARQGNKPLLWPLIGFVSFVGFKIKPTVMIVFIAIALLELLSFRRCRIFRDMLLAFGGLLVGMAFCSMIVFLSGYQLDRERAFGPAHFFAMGLNEQSGGTWSLEDHVYSMTFPTVKERTRGDLELAKSRMKEMGVHRLLKHLIRKTAINYSDGTFSWGGEGDFFRLVREETDPVLSPWIRSFYYANGSKFVLFANFEEAVWVGVLLLSVFSAFSKANIGSGVTALSLLGMLAYSLLFEARGRYLYVFAPFFILIAAVGLSAIFEKLRGLRRLNT